MNYNLLYTYIIALSCLCYSCGRNPKGDKETQVTKIDTIEQLFLVSKGDLYRGINMGIHPEQLIEILEDSITNESPLLIKSQFDFLFKEKKYSTQTEYSFNRKKLWIISTRIQTDSATIKPLSDLIKTHLDTKYGKNNGTTNYSTWLAEYKGYKRILISLVNETKISAQPTLVLKFELRSQI